jgi:hypothetical protein
MTHEVTHRMCQLAWALTLILTSVHTLAGLLFFMPTSCF